MFRIVAISDTHSLHNKMVYRVEDFIDPNRVNILIHAGDCTNMGRENEVGDFINWFKNIEGFDKKIFIAGNHDFGFESKPTWLKPLIDEEKLHQFNCVYLEDREYLFTTPKLSKPIKIYGTPWQPEFYNWAFNLPRGGKELEEKWNKIPDDCDVLISHGPPQGILDYYHEGNVIRENLGCNLLRFRVEQIKPKIHIFGHIHSSHNIKSVGETLFVNASICNEGYKPIYKPLIVDITEENNKLYIENYE